LTTPKDWWREEGSGTPGPARIRVTFNRSLTEAEKEHLREVGSRVAASVGDKIRVAGDSRIYLESYSVDSRALFRAASSLAATSFVNVFPIAVRTFRELRGTAGAALKERIANYNTTVQKLDEPTTAATKVDWSAIRTIAGPLPPKLPEAQYPGKKKGKKK